MSRLTATFIVGGGIFVALIAIPLVLLMGVFRTQAPALANCVVFGQVVPHGTTWIGTDPNTQQTVSVSCNNGQANFQNGQPAPAPILDCLNVPELRGNDLLNGQSAPSFDGKQMIACVDGKVAHQAWIAPTVHPVIAPTATPAKPCFDNGLKIENGQSWQLNTPRGTVSVICKDGGFVPTGLPQFQPTPAPNTPPTASYVGPGGCSWAFFNPAWASLGQADLDDEFNPDPRVLWRCIRTAGHPTGKIWHDPAKP